MSKEAQLELKVGAFVLASFVAFTIFIVSVGDFFLFEKGKNLQVIFNFANGLRKTAPVRFAGVDAGVVKGITVFYDEKEQKTKVHVDVWLQHDVDVPQDSVAIVNQLGLLGEKYLEILPGKDKAHPLADNSILQGKDPVPMEELSSNFGVLADKLNNTIDGVNAIVANKENHRAIETTLTGMSEIMTNLKEGHGTLGRFLYDDSIYDEFEAFTADIRQNPWKLLYRPPEARRARH